ACGRRCRSRRRGILQRALRVHHRRCEQHCPLDPPREQALHAQLLLRHLLDWLYDRCGFHGGKSHRRSASLTWLAALLLPLFNTAWKDLVKWPCPPARRVSAAAPWAGGRRRRRNSRRLLGETWRK
ncbi:hypothetical protein PENTCL1PPCAC_14414, partial [Pristionchus entomophagus]